MNSWRSSSLCTRNKIQGGLLEKWKFLREKNLSSTSVLRTHTQRHSYIKIKVQRSQSWPYDKQKMCGLRTGHINHSYPASQPPAHTGVCGCSSPDAGLCMSLCWTQWGSCQTISPSSWGLFEWQTPHFDVSPSSSQLCIFSNLWRLHCPIT